MGNGHLLPRQRAALKKKQVSNRAEPAGLEGRHGGLQRLDTRATCRSHETEGRLSVRVRVPKVLRVPLTVPSSGLSPSSPRCVPATLRARMLHGSACDRPVRDESTVVHAIAPELQRGDRNTIHAHDAPSAPDLARSGHIQHGIGRLTPTSAPGSRARTTVSRDYPSCGSQISRSWTRPLTLDPKRNDIGVAQLPCTQDPPPSTTKPRQCSAACGRAP